jgi:hypothetical protein
VVKDGDSEWGKKLARFLDDAISNIVPDDPDPGLGIPSSNHHPCTVRGVNLNEPDPDLQQYLLDLYNKSGVTAAFFAQQLHGLYIHPRWSQGRSDLCIICISQRPVGTGLRNAFGG